MALEFHSLDRRHVCASDGHIISIYKDTIYIPFRVALDIGLCDAKHNIMSSHIDLRCKFGKIYIFRSGNEYRIRQQTKNKDGYYIACKKFLDEFNIKDLRMKYKFVKEDSRIGVLLINF